MSSQPKYCYDDGLLNTIKLPRVLNHLQDKFPKPAYLRQQSQPSRLASLAGNSNPVSPKNVVTLVNESSKHHHRPISGHSILQK